MVDIHVFSSKTLHNPIAIVCASFIYAVAERSPPAGRRASLQILSLEVFSYHHCDSMILKPVLSIEIRPRNQPLMLGWDALRVTPT